MKKFKIISVLLLVVLVASFILVGCTTKTYKIDVVQGEHGTIAVDNANVASDEVVTVTVTPDKDYRLVLGGLAYTSDKFGTSYPVGNTFIMLPQDTVLTAKFEKIPVIENGKSYARVDENGNASATGKTIYFGEYPQSIKADAVTITGEIAGKAGYYNGSDGMVYLKKTGTGFNENVVYSNGSKINEVETYFLVVPMTWTVLSEKDGAATILSNSLLDSQAFLEKENTTDPHGPGNRYNTKIDGKDSKVYANNYEQSDIREFLNGDFYTSAFSDAQKALVNNVTNINNDGGVFDNKYSKANGNTEDKVYLLTYDDLFNAELGFQTFDDYKQKKVDPLKSAFTTDFARANGAFTDTLKPKNGGKGYWSTRSTGELSYMMTTITSAAGYVNNHGINTSNANVGVRPVITITLK